MRVTLLNLFDRHGGAETCVRSLLDGLKGRGHAVRLLVGSLLTVLCLLVSGLHYFRKMENYFADVV